MPRYRVCMISATDEHLDWLSSDRALVSGDLVPIGGATWRVKTVAINEADPHDGFVVLERADA